MLKSIRINLLVNSKDVYQEQINEKPLAKSSSESTLTLSEFPQELLVLEGTFDVFMQDDVFMVKKKALNS